MHGEKKEGYIPIKEREREGRKEKRKKILVCMLPCTLPFSLARASHAIAVYWNV